MSLTKRSIYKAPQQKDSIGLGGVCNSFLTRGYCTKYNCNYLHTLPVCKYFQTPGGCWKGDKCRYKHDTGITAKQHTKQIDKYTTTVKNMSTNSTTSTVKKIDKESAVDSTQLEPFREWIHTSKRNPHEKNPLPTDFPSPENPFRVGMKLEAVDRKFQGLFCVASILRVAGDEVLIYFDGWSDEYNYWCRFNSPEIRPIHTCERNRVVLQTPNRRNGAQDIWDSGKGVWEAYLSNTNSSTLSDEKFSPLFLPQSGSAISTLSELSARVLLFYHMDTSKLPFQLHTRIQHSLTCMCQTEFLIGWTSVRMFTCQDMLDPQNPDFPERTRIVCSQKCAAQFSTEQTRGSKSAWDYLV